MKLNSHSLIVLVFFAILALVPARLSAEDPITSAHTLAMGNIQGFNFSSEAIFENPASLLLRSKSSASLFFTTYMGGDTTSMVFTGADTLSPGVVLGVGYIQNTIDNFISTQENDSNEFESTGTFGYKEAYYALGASWAMTPSISVGISGTYITQHFASDHGHSAQVNVGCLYHTDPWCFSFVQKNMLTSPMIFDNNTEQSTYGQQIFGISYTPNSWLSFYSELNNVQTYGFLKAVGAEYKMNPHGLQIRCGWHEIYTSGKISSAISLGLGFEITPFQLNYAYSPSDYVFMPETHFVSVQVDF